MMAIAFNRSFLSSTSRSMKLARAAAVGAALALGSMLALPANAQGTKVGFVNTERVLRESGPAKAAQAKLDSEFKSREATVKRAQDKLLQLNQRLERDGATLSQSEGMALQRQADEARYDFDRQRRAASADFAERQNELLKNVIDSANKAIKTIAERENYDIILQDAVTVNPANDITDKVIQALGR